MTKSSISHITLTAPLSVAVRLSSCVNTLELAMPQGERRVMSHEGGGLVDRSFLYDREQTNEENIADFVSVMEGLMLGVARANNGTRTDVEILYFGGVGDTIIETAYTKDYSDHLGYNSVSGDVSYDYELLTAISENCDDYGKD